MIQKSKLKLFEDKGRWNQIDSSGIGLVGLNEAYKCLLKTT